MIVTTNNSPCFSAATTLVALSFLVPSIRYTHFVPTFAGWYVTGGTGNAPTRNPHGTTRARMTTARTTTSGLTNSWLGSCWQSPLPGSAGRGRPRFAAG